MALLFEPLKRLPQTHGRVLPKLVGLAHINEHLMMARSEIDRLPPRSTVGLEFDGADPSTSSHYYQARQRLTTVLEGLGITFKPAFFTEVARYAKAKGHRVKWIERAKAHRAGLIDDFPFLYHATRRAVHCEQCRENVIPALNRLEKNLEKKRTSRIIAVSQWRSRRMAKEILKTKDWKPTDIVITGASHTLHLMSLLHPPRVEFHTCPHSLTVEQISAEHKMTEQKTAALDAIRLAKRREVQAKYYRRLASRKRK